MDIFTELVLKDKVNLRPSDLDGDYKNYIFHLLRSRYEGQCSRHGYIRKSSIKIRKIGMGYVQMVSLNGDVMFHVEFSADICLPIVGNIVKGTVKNMNKFGILCDVSRDNVVVMEAIIAKNSIEIKSEINLDELKIGDVVNIEVLGRKFQLRDKKISVIGRVVLNFKHNRVMERALQKTANGFTTVERRGDDLDVDGGGSESNSSSSDDNDEEDDDGDDKEEDDDDENDIDVDNESASGRDEDEEDDDVTDDVVNDDEDDDDDGLSDSSDMVDDN